MNFQERLFTLRRQAGLSQEELANLLGITRQAVQKWEAGTSRPDMDNLTALAEYFQVSLDYLILGKERTSPSAPTVVNNHYHEHRWHYEYKSKRTLFGLPLMHINCGPGIHWARGIIAIGDVATGLIALGGLSIGLLSLGGLSFGLLLALGGAALGGVSVGGLSVGLMAWGGISIGVLSIGGIALGVYTFGGLAVGSKVAIGGAASAPLAIGAAADGARAILVPPEGLHGAELEAARAAIDEACQGAPGFFAGLLKSFAKFIVS